MQHVGRLVIMVAAGLVGGCQEAKTEVKEVLTPSTPSAVEADVYYAVNVKATVTVARQFEPPNPPTQVAELVCRLGDLANGLTCLEQASPQYLGIVMTEGKATLTHHASPTTPPQRLAQQTCPENADQGRRCSSRRARDGSVYVSLLNISAVARTHSRPPHPPGPEIQLSCSGPTAAGSLTCYEPRTSTGSDYLGVEISGSVATLRRHSRPPNPPQAVAMLNCVVTEDSALRCVEDR